MPHRLASGEIRIVEVWTSPIQENEKMLFYAVIHDITEKVKAEQQLQVEKDNFKTILKALPDLIFRLDKDNRFVYYHTSGRPVNAGRSFYWQAAYRSYSGTSA